MNRTSVLPSGLIVSLLSLVVLTSACASSGLSIPEQQLPTWPGVPEEVAATADHGDGWLTQEADDKAVTARPHRVKSHSSMQIFIGGRNFKDEALWGPVEDQLVIGSEFDWIAAESVFGFEIGFQASFGAETEEVGALSIDQGGSSTELYVGPRFDTTLFGSTFHLVAGVGPSLLSARRSREVTSSVRSGSESSLGLYAHVGFMLDLGDVGLGLDYRGRSGEEMTGFEDVFGTKITGDADYGQLALTLSLLF